MRAIHLYCDGGFGNRFNTLVAGLLLARHAGLLPVVVWPRNNWCGASYDELIENDAVVLDRELSTYVPEHHRFHFFMTEDHLKMGVANRSPLQVSTLAEALAWLAASEKDVHFHTPLIPGFLAVDSVLAQVRALRLRRHIVERADAFVAEQRLDAYFGVQIRKTDFGPNGADDNALFELLSRRADLRFFVCSDDQAVEQRFAALPNVLTYPKRAWVERRVDGGWNTPTADHSGRVYACNVSRSAQSVEDALVDLLLLSRSQVVKTSNSTFLNTALLLQAAAAASQRTGVGDACVSA
jgi:hypothetical protein